MEQNRCQKNGTADGNPDAIRVDQCPGVLVPSEVGGWVGKQVLLASSFPYAFPYIAPAE